MQGNPASSSDLPSATNTDVPKSETPVGAITSGKSPLPLLTPSQQQGLRCRLFALRLSGTIGGLAVLCIIGFGLLFLRKRGDLKIPRIRKASGPGSLFDSKEGRLDPRMEEAAAVRRLLLYVRNTLSFSF
jgi:hypothetical protein